jgi:hypothetical protein
MLRINRYNRHLWARKLSIVESAVKPGSLDWNRRS